MRKFSFLGYFVIPNLSHTSTNSFACARSSQYNMPYAPHCIGEEMLGQLFWGSCHFGTFKTISLLASRLARNCHSCRKKSSKFVGNIRDEQIQYQLLCLPA